MSEKREEDRDHYRTSCRAVFSISFSNIPHIGPGNLLDFGK